MKYSFLIFGLFALISLFTSCSDDNFDTTETETEQIDVKKSNSQNNIMTRASSSDDQATDLIFDCISLKYPFELIDVDGNTIVVDNDAQYESVVYDSLVVDFKYPLNLLDSDSEDVVVEDAEEFAELFAACIPENIWDDSRFPAYLIDDANECYALVFPLSVQNDAGENQDIDNKDEFLEAITKEILYFNFPFSITTTDGSEYSINNIDDFYNAIFECNGFETDSLGLNWEDGFEYIGCFKYEFPISIIDVEGSTVEVENHEALCDLMIEGKIVDFVYPLQLLNDEEESLTINSNEELDLALFGCYDETPYYNGEISVLLQGTALRIDDPCYSINYPISLVQIDTIGNTATVDVLSDEELELFEFDNYSISYPVTINYTDGDELVVEQYEQLWELSAICFEVFTSIGADPNVLLEFDGTCFDISYPINAIVFDTANWEITGEFELIKAYNNREELEEDIFNVFHIEFPFKVILKSDGKEEEIINREDFESLLEVCG